ncbi:hypothetical protein [Comamonas testosteroni]|jgi:hypothetical protein|uniref:hypothetical protein n=1 Tax=Comamonas testosteroni TaxID=285 RepID=UPI0026EB09B5|nr:hypothetical protein [Comamonas testosteroni]
MKRLKSVFHWWIGHLNRRRYEHYLHLSRQGGFEAAFRVAHLSSGGHRHFHHQSRSEIQKAFATARSKSA